MADIALQRKNMVESQIRPSDITDRRITAAMSSTPREAFVPPAVAPLAYSDETLIVGQDRALVAPRVLAQLIQLADIDGTDTVLVIGSWPGYAAAIAAQLAKKVVVLVADAAVSASVDTSLQAAGITNATTVSGPLQSGASAKGPFNVILIEGVADDVPAELQKQLAPGGRLVATHIDRGVGRAFVLLRTEDEILARRNAFEASAPMLQAFKTKGDAFVF